MTFWHRVNKHLPSNKRVGFFSLALFVVFVSVFFLGAEKTRADSISWTISGYSGTGGTTLATFNASTDKDIYNPGETVVVHANGSIQFSDSGLTVFALLIYTDISGVSAAYTPCYGNPFSCSASLVAPTEPGTYYVKLEGYSGSITPITRWLRIIVPQPLTCGPANTVPTIGQPSSSSLCGGAFYPDAYNAGNVIYAVADAISLSGQTWQWTCSLQGTQGTVSCSAPNIVPPTVTISPASQAIMLTQSAHFTVHSSSPVSNIDFDLILWQPPDSTTWSNGAIQSSYVAGTISGGSDGTGYSFVNPITNSHSTTYTFTPSTAGTFHFRGGARVVNGAIYNSPLPGAILNVCSAGQTIVNGACIAATPPTASISPLTPVIAYGTKATLALTSANSTACGMYTWDPNNVGRSVDVPANPTANNVTTNYVTDDSNGLTIPGIRTFAFGCTNPNPAPNGASGWQYTTVTVCNLGEVVVNGACTTPLPDLIGGPTTVNNGNPVTVNQSVPLSGTLSASPSGGTATGFPDMIQIGLGPIVYDSNGNPRPSSVVTRFAGSPSPIASLTPGASATVTGSYSFPTVNTYAVRTCANIDAVTWSWGITEWNAANNMYGNNCGAWTPITVSEPPAVNLKFL